MNKYLCLFLALCMGLGAAAQSRRTATVSGYITDGQSGETLIGAGALVEGGDTRSQTGAVTNVYGYYTLTIPRGAVRIQYSYVGYESLTMELDLQRDTAVNVVLTPAAEIKESVVVAQRDAGIQSSYLGAVDVPIAQIQNTPVLFGEADVLKAIQMMPGVQGGNEGFTGLYVRGGGPDENLVMLDGVPIYNVDHMLGILSVFQTEAVKKVTLYKGSFPARYGGRVSSIVDIRTNDGNMKETHGVIGVGALTEKFHLEGPILKDKLSYSISARGLHTLLYDPLIRLALKKNHAYANYFFYDVSGKVTWRLSDKDRFFLGGYSGLDRMGIQFQNDINNYDWDEENQATITRKAVFRTDMNIGWGNNVASLRWNHIFNNRLFANTTVSFNRYKMLMHMGMKEELGADMYRFDVDYNSGIRDWSGKLDFDYVPDPRHLVKFGAEYTYHTFVPETLSAITKEATDGKEETPFEFRTPTKNYGGHDLNFYAEDDFTIGPHFTLNPGIHLSVFRTDGKTYVNAQPRVSAKYGFDNGIYFKAGYARMAQYVHLLSSFSISLPMDLWVPITKDIKPVTSDQFSVGTYYDGLPGWEFSVEAYYKNIDNLLEYKDGTIVLGSSLDWETKVEMGRGRAMGLEFFVQKTAGKLTGWVAYTLAKSDRIFPDGSINLGQWFPYKYDRRHNFNINLNYQLKSWLELNVAWIFASGSTTTLPLRRSAVVDPENEFHTADYVQYRNNYRLPPSHRLNVGATFKPGRHSLINLSIYNVYNQMNPNLVFINYDGYMDSKGEWHYKPVMEKITILPFIPSVSYTYKF